MNNEHFNFKEQTRSPGSPPNREHASIMSVWKVIDVHFSEPAVECTFRKSLLVSCILQYNIDKKRENFLQKEYFGRFTEQMGIRVQKEAYQVFNVMLLR